MAPSMNVYITTCLLMGRLILGLYDEVSDWLYYYTVNIDDPTVKNLYVFFIIA